MSNQLDGKIVKVISNKTVKVAILNRVPHKLYKKIITKITNLMCHVPESVDFNLLENGKVVKIQESRPYSKTKHHILVDIKI